MLKSALVIAVLVTRRRGVSKSQYGDPTEGVLKIMTKREREGGHTARAESVAVNPILGVVNGDLSRQVDNCSLGGAVAS